MSRDAFISVPDLEMSDDDADGFDVMNTPCACCSLPTLSPDPAVTLCPTCENP